MPSLSPALFKRLQAACYKKVAKQQSQALQDHLIAYCGLFCGGCVIRCRG